MIERYFMIYKWGICSKIHKLCIAQKSNLFSCKGINGYSILSDKHHTCKGNVFLKRDESVDSFAYFKGNLFDNF